MLTIYSDTHRLHHGKGGNGGRVSAQDARPEGDRRHEGLAAQQGALHQLTDGPFASQMADLVTYLETEEPVPEEELLAHWDAYAASVQPKAPMQSMLSAVTESAKKGLAGLLRHRRNSPWRHRLR